MNNVIKRPT